MAVTLTPDSKARLNARMAAFRRNAAANVAALVVDELLAVTPVENGHAHQSWITAALEAAGGLGANGVAVSRAAAIHDGEASGDPTAKAAGHGSVVESQHATRVAIETDLHFVNVLEFGGTLTPIAPGGRKLHGIRGPGPLLSPRARVGTGLLMWTDSGGSTRFARSRTFAAGGYVRRALLRVRQAVRAEGRAE